MMKAAAELEGLLGYQLQRAELVMTEDARRALAPHGMTPAKLTALLLIRANPGCDQTMLGRALSVNRSSSMKLVNFLVDRALVERRPGRDLRTNALHLAPDAEHRIHEMLRDLSESDCRIAERLTAAERDQLFALLRRLGTGKRPRTRSATD